MNAITYWISEHFGFSRWCAYMSEGNIELKLIAIGIDTHLTPRSRHNYIALDLGLLGLCCSLSYWPQGKYDETDGAGA